jgi:exopolysaccharide production protein ExoQ
VPVGRNVQTASAVILLIVLSSAPFIELSRLAGLTISSTSWAYIYPYWGAALVCCGAMLLRAERVGVSRSSRPRLVALGAFGLVTFLSPLWANTAYGSPADSLLVLLLLPAGVWLGIALDARQRVMALFVSSQLLVLGSLLEVHVRPKVAISPDLAWMGVFGNRNTLAPIAGLGVLASFGLWVVFRHYWLIGVGIAASLLDLHVLRKTASATNWLALLASLGVLVVVGLVLLVIRHQLTRPMQVALAVVAVALGIPAGVALFDKVTSSLHKTTSLSDRRHLWSYLWDVSSGHRWFGYGFNSFWKDDALVLPVSTPIFRWNAAHNSFVEIYIGMGLIGFVLILIFLFFAFEAVVRRVRTHPTLASALPAMLLVFLIVQNLSESMIVYNSSFWILLIAVAFTNEYQPAVDRVSRDQAVERGTA